MEQKNKDRMLTPPHRITAAPQHRSTAAPQHRSTDLWSIPQLNRIIYAGDFAAYYDIGASNIITLLAKKMMIQNYG